MKYMWKEFIAPYLYENKIMYSFIRLIDFKDLGIKCITCDA